MSTEHRAHFDADVAFSNGGSLSVRDFRLDVPGADIDERSLAALFVRHLGLLMVGSVGCMVCASWRSRTRARAASMCR